MKTAPIQAKLIRSSVDPRENPTTLILEERSDGQVNVRLMRRGFSEANNFPVAQMVADLREMGYLNEILKGLCCGGVTDAV